MVRRYTFAIVLVGALPVPGIAATMLSDESLIALIECRADPQEWGGLAFSIMGDPGAVEALGWTPLPATNPFLQEYELESPLTVFGHETNRLALTASGPMAVLSGVEPTGLAAELGIEPLVSDPQKFLGEKVIVETTDESDSMKFHTRVAINVSTVDTHPGMTFAGCSYVIETVE